MNKAISLLAVMFTIVMACPAEEAALQETDVSDFRAGQVWHYKTRPGEEASRLVVCRVDANEKLGTIIHIHVEGVAIKSPTSPDGLSRVVGHMPFAEEALRKSVVTTDETREPLPDFEEGYNTWKEAFEEGNAGVFTISVAEGIEFMEQALNR